MGTDSRESLDLVNPCRSRTIRRGKLSVASSLQPGHHHQVAIANSPPSHHRTTQHVQLATETTHQGQLEGERRVVVVTRGFLLEREPGG